jgi:hypothetical protein
MTNSSDAVQVARKQERRSRVSRALLGAIGIALFGCSDGGNQNVEVAVENAQRAAHAGCDADISAAVDREAQNLRDTLANGGDATGALARLNNHLVECRSRKQVASARPASQAPPPPNLPPLDRSLKGPLTVTGFTLGQPLPNAQCKTGPPTKSSDYTDGLCWQTDTELADPKVKIVWFDGTAPPIGFAMRVYLNDIGLVNGLGFETLGVRDQDDVLRALSLKYGKPFVLERRQLTNLLGVRASAIHAEWTNSQVFVEFDGLNERFDRGWAHIETAADHKEHLENQRRFMEQRPRL